MIISKYKMFFLMTVVFITVIFLLLSLTFAESKVCAEQLLSSDINTNWPSGSGLELKSLSSGHMRVVAYIAYDITDSSEDGTERRFISPVHTGISVRSKASAYWRALEQNALVSHLNISVLAIFLGGHSPPGVI